MDQSSTRILKLYKTPGEKYVYLGDIKAVPFARNKISPDAHSFVC